jgi:hypothetical protein
LIEEKMFTSREPFSARITRAVTLGRSLGLPGPITGTTVEASDVGQLLSHPAVAESRRSAGQDYRRVGRYYAHRHLLASR